MFSGLASQPLSVPLRNMEPVSNQNSSLLNMHTGITGPMSTNPASHFAVSNQQNTASDLVSNVSETENLMVSDKQLMLNQKSGEMGPMRSNVGLQTPLLPSKRKAAAEPLPQQSSVPNKRVVQMEAHVNSPRLSPLSAPNKKPMQLPSTPNSQGSLGLSNKRMMRNESISSKTGSPRVQTSKSKTVATEVSPKVSSESYEAVRMKMRDTLAAALSVGNQNKEEASNEDKSAPQEAHVNSQSASAAPLVEADAALDNKQQEDRGSTAGETAPEINIQNLDQTGKSDGEKPQYNYVMPDTEGSFGDTFFVKDELLQGNGLSWAWDMDVAELKEVQTDEKSNSVPMQGQGAERENLDDMDTNGNEVKEVVSSPQDLAFKIEAELFKLFGGVNKKYKEKGRSLMFNLKDRNNPELREKVLSGKISPERLCSMTPEELASKELSEWRMAKAEELDKMIVLPDSDANMRRLVKKTHKGEYQVEVDQDDGVSVEVSVGSSSLTQFRPKKKKTERLSSAAEVKEKVVDEGDKSASEKLDTTGSASVSTDGTDFMQELIVDEFKDEGFLPPIVSLDEFMESLNSEPPFENLPVDAKEAKLPSDKDNPETGGETGNEKASSGPTSANPVEAGACKNDRLNVKTTESLSSVTTNETSAERKLLRPFSAIGECLWEGDLQLTLSSTVSVIGLFRSGEKTSTKEWPGSMEIKGRVRLDAFEKFLQELPMSRSRAVMVVHFVLKDASSEYHKASLSEAVDSYVAEERVGFGEPIPGVELYFCPPHKRITEMLSRLLSKDQNDILKTTDNGLIGVVVWRRPHPTSAVLPNSSSHHKHHRKHLSSRRQENINSNTNSNTTSKSLPFGHGQPPQPNDGEGGDDDDDIPPGFGPGVVARDEDDLPEFSFSKGSNSSGQTLPAQVGLGPRMSQSNLAPRPVAQMRQLIYEYGQTGNDTAGSGPTNWNGNRGSGIENRPWHQDDDDDIPEWQPHLQNRQRPEVPNHSIQEVPRVHLVNQIRPAMGPNVPPVMPIRQPVNPLQNSWVQPPLPHGLPPHAAITGQYYGGQWRQDEPRGRGF